MLKMCVCPSLFYPKKSFVLQLFSVLSPLVHFIILCPLSGLIGGGSELRGHVPKKVSITKYI